MASRLSAARRIALAGLPALVFGIACADDPISSAGSQIPAERLSSAVDDPSHLFVPNEIRYREPAYTHGTGRAGGAQLTARALLSRDGTTLIEATTGALDGDPGAEELQKVQLKFFTPDGSLIGTRNVGPELPDGGYAAFEQEGLPWHGHVQVTANVRTANPRDRNRTGVVTLEERVNRRPDLTILSVQAPETVDAGASVELSAVLAELNGDVPAAANLVLYVDGREVDRVENLWIAEGDVVSAWFTREFHRAGTFELSLQFEDVTPGDWDGSNNVATHRITVRDDFATIFGTARAQEVHDRVLTHGEGWSLRHSDGFREEWNVDVRHAHDWQSLGVSANTLGAMEFPVELRFTVFNDEDVLFRVERTITEPTRPGSRVSCYHERVEGDETLGILILEFCVQDWGVFSRSWAGLTRIAGAISYLSAGYYRTRFPDDEAWRYLDLDETTPADVEMGGTLESWGSHLAVSVRISDSGPLFGMERFGFDLDVPLTRVERDLHATLSGEGDCSDEENWMYWDTETSSGGRCNIVFQELRRVVGDAQVTF